MYLFPTVWAIWSLLIGGTGDLSTPLPTSSQSVAQLQRLSSGAAHVRESAHFVLVHDAAPRTARELLARAEAVYRASDRLARELDLSIQPPAQRLEILLFARYDDFRAYRESAGYGDEQILGFYDLQANRSAFFDLATYPPIIRLRTDLQRAEAPGTPDRRRLSEQLRRNTEALLMTVVQHEVAHQVHHNTGLLPADGGAPAWLIEGLAQMFELPFVERGATLALATNRYRLVEFARLYADEVKLRADLPRLVADDEAMSDAEHYCLSWALTNYLYKRRRLALAAYVRQVAAVRTVPSPEGRRREFESFFGLLGPELVGDFRDYLRRLEDRLGVRQSGREALGP